MDDMGRPMSEEFVWYDTPRAVREIGAGNDGALFALWDRYNEKMVRAATRLLRELRIDDAEYDADQAVNNTLFKLCQPANRAKLSSMKDSDEFWSFFAVVLEREILEVADYFARRKRGGAGTSR